MRRQPHISSAVQDGLAPRVLLHHSRTLITESIAPRLEDTRELPNDDYSMVAGSYKGHRITLVATHMGVDESLNIVDQLAQLGVNTFIKLGTFVSLMENMPLGEIRVPDAAVSLPSSVDAILPRGQRPKPSKEVADCIMRTAQARGIDVKAGTVLTCPVYGPYIRDEVVDPIFSIDYWRPECFGDEMECSAVFAAAAFSGARSAAVLVCNRTWAVLDAYRRGHREDWTAHANSETYVSQYDLAIDLALDSLIDCHCSS